MRGTFSRICILSVTLLAATSSLATGAYSSTKTDHPIDARDKDAAITSKAINHFEVIGALGIADPMLGSGVLGVTSNETDFLVKPNGTNWSTFAAQAGVGFVHYFPGAMQYSENLQWFPSIEAELNGYYLGQGNFTSAVWRFNSPAFNEMTYHLSIQSTRLMVDGALTIASKKQFSLYTIGGIGNAWNRLNYSDNDNNNTAACPDQGLNLGSHTHSNFAWELGAGVTYAFNPRVLLSLEYLYANLGTAQTSAHGNTGSIAIPNIVPAQLHLNSQAALLGLHIAL